MDSVGRVLRLCISLELGVHVRVGFIGLGAQGGPMAQRIIDSGYATTLWARRAASLEPYRDSGATFAASPAELASHSDAICVCVTGDADVTQVFDAMYPSLVPGTIIAVQSTIHPNTCATLAERAASCGAVVIDAPVSGGGRAAAAGELLVMVGGDPEAFARVKPVFDTYADPVIHLGPLGSGQLAKLVNNALLQANMTLANDALQLGLGFGIDEATMARVLGSGSGNSYALGVVAEFGLDRIAELGAALTRKDVDIVSEVAAERGLGTGMLVTVANGSLTLMGYPPRP